MSLNFMDFDKILEDARMVAEAFKANKIYQLSMCRQDEEGKKFLAPPSEYFSEQVSNLEKALKMFPEYTEFYAGKIGELYFQLNDLDNARVYLEKAVDAEPIINPYFYSIPKNRNMLAIVNLTEKKAVDAESLLKQSLKKERENAGTDVLLSYSYLLTNEYEKALNISDNSIQRLLKLNFPDFTLLAHNFAVNLKANEIIHGQEKAEQFYSELIQRLNFLNQNNLETHLEHIYGTCRIHKLFELIPILEFEKLKYLTIGSYKDTSD
ncbi:MAG: tetratricopeptide repeat protein [Nanoarchaeota archaeon]